MRKIGILGGMGWYSTSLYYNKINTYINQIRNSKINPEIIMISVNFEQILKLQEENRWDKIEDILIPKAKQIELAGADFLVIPSNTVHKIADKIEEMIEIPVLNIVEVIGKKLSKSWCKKPGLLATKYLINDGFYQRILEEKYNQRVIIPDKKEIEELNDIIVNELINNSISADSKFYINSIIDELMYRDVDSIILGCTELSSIIDVIASRNVKIINSTELHIRETVHLTVRKNL